MRRGTSNRRTGKTTPRKKAKTHWVKMKGRPSRPAASGKSGKLRNVESAKA